MSRAIAVSVLLALAGVSGCASRQKNALDPINIPIARQTIDQLQPPVALQPAASQPTSRPSVDALQLYAQGRDALLSNHKQIAVEKLTAALQLDDASSVTYRDLGYAWFGTDNVRSLAAFRRAAEIDPQDLEIYSQVARLQTIANRPTEAIRTLRLARLTDDYRNATTNSTIIDMQLGLLLSNAGYTTAALDCFERVLPVIERRPMELRRWPELVELSTNPSGLRLKIADLSASIEHYDRALGLYREVQNDEPMLGPAIELRIIQVRANQGQIADASKQMLAIVDRFEANRTSVQSYRDLFSTRGGDPAALAMVQQITAKDAIDTSPRRVVQARILRLIGQPSQAVTVLDQPPVKASLASVREVVLAYRDAKRESELPIRLLQMMVDQPAQWASIWRGWHMLMSPMQPAPLSLNDLHRLNVAPDLAAAKAFVAGRVALKEGQTRVSRELFKRSLELNTDQVRNWTKDQSLNVVPDVLVDSDLDLARYIDEFSDDPDYLRVSVEYLVKTNATPQITSALGAAMVRRPANLAALSNLVELLAATDRKPEAIKAIEQSTRAVKSAPEVYQLSAMASRIEESELAEKLLRQAVTVNPSYAPSCNDLGYLLVDSGRELDFAEGLLWKAIAIEPGNAAYLDSLGWLLYKREKFADAAEYLDKAVNASDPADPVVLDHVGDTAYRVGDQAKSKSSWEQAIEQIKKNEASEPQLRLRLEQKLRKQAAGETVDVAPTLAK